MTPCSNCGCHVRNADITCPVCGERRDPARGGRNLGAAALLLGLVACVGEDKTTTPTGDTGSVQADYGVTTTVEPEYGVTVTTHSGGGSGTVGSTGDTGTTTGGTGSVGGTGETGGTGSTGSTGVDYGVPIALPPPSGGGR